jgi:glycosyltransferase involved in cell wall biosynthesis
MAETPLRVLVVGNLPPHVLGGAENQIARLVGCWAALGAHVEVAGHRIPDGEQLLGAHRIRTHRLRPWSIGGRLGRGLGYLLSLWRLAWRRRGDFDVAYCRGLGDGALALGLARALGLVDWKLVVVPINAGGTGDAHFLRSLPAWQLWCRVLDRNIDAFNLINTQVAADLDALGLGRASRWTIPNGIPLRPPRTHASPSAARRLVWTGRFEPQKGLDLLLPALATCMREGATFRLTLWGEGSLREQLRSLSLSLGLGNHVEFAGVRTAESIRDALLHADAFLLPSRYEGMSNSALEAMEAGLPVLCTRCGGVDEYVQDGAGWVCAPDDPQALLAALRRMFSESDESWLSRGMRARALVEARFAMDTIAAANLDLLERVTRSDTRA